MLLARRPLDVPQSWFDKVAPVAVTDLAEVLATRKRLAEAAHGDALLVQTRGLCAPLGTASGTDLLRRIAQASLLLRYGFGRPVLLADVVDGTGTAACLRALRDLAAVTDTRDCVTLVEELVAEGPPKHRPVLTPLVRAARFGRAYGFTLPPAGGSPLLVCDRPRPRAQAELGISGYDPGAHLVVAGRVPDGWACGYLARLANPVVVDVTPTDCPQEIVAACDRLDPDRSPGRLVLRLSAQKSMVEPVRREAARQLRCAGHRPVWLVLAPSSVDRSARADLRHANGVVLAGGAGHGDPNRRHRSFVDSVCHLVAALLSPGERGPLTGPRGRSG